MEVVGMGQLSKRATVYLEPVLHRALRLKAVETSKSISELVNEAVRFSLAEDAEDLAAFGQRIKEPLVPYEAFLKELKQNGRI
jgi:hypothetical protein